MKFLQLIFVLAILCIMHQTCAALRGSSEERPLEDEADKAKSEAEAINKIKEMSDDSSTALRHLEELSTYTRALEEELAAYGGLDQRFLEEVSAFIFRGYQVSVFCVLRACG